MRANPEDAELWPGFQATVAQAMSGRKTIGAVVYDLVRDAILSGELAPEQRLKQEELASAIGVSRIPVRTALMQLDSEGLVSFHPHKGAVVRSLTIDQVQEIYEIREVLEVHALRKSMVVMTAARIARLRELADALDAQAEGTAFTDLRVEFYRELYDAVRNPQLTKMIDDLRNGVGRYLLGRRVSHGGAGHGTHRALVEAVAKGDVDKAEGVLRSHLHSVRSGVEEIIDQASKPGSKPGAKPASGSGRTPQRPAGQAARSNGTRGARAPARSGTA